MHIRSIVAGLIQLISLFVAACFAAAGNPNILLITVDDMSCDSVGSFGCALEGTTPHMDKLASEGLKFEHAHVQVGNCFPSRNVLLSGRYPHTSGVEGFYQIRDFDFPVMNDILQKAGFFTGIRGKVGHSTPYTPYPWSADLTILPDGKKANLKDVESYYTSTKAGIATAVKEGKPFFINVNISDPHKPFWYPGDKHPASRIYTADEVPIPGFLFDDPKVREELALYYTSVRRADDCVGATLRALEESGLSDGTIVMFLSDHGMPLPFAKTQLYHHSTRTPWIVRWPGVTTAGASDAEHMISAVDFVPTVCEILGLEIPKGVNGRSFAALLKGEKEEGWDYVFKEYNENSGGNRHPIRGVESKEYLYLFNPWADGERAFKTATQGTMTYRRMKELAPMRPDIAARLDLFDHRVVEELYHVGNDPDCLVNLIDDPAHKEGADKMRASLHDWMEETNDHALEAFEAREDPAKRLAYVEKVEAESAERRAEKRSKRRAASGNNQENLKLIRMKKPQLGKSGSVVNVVINHELTDEMGEQPIVVTLKQGNKGKRVQRKELKAKGEGTLKVSFDVPAEVEDNVLQVAAFVGADFQSSMQHVNSEKVRLE
ncbi:MAG: sulfatase [Verrucomicrobiota bacterium]